MSDRLAARAAWVVAAAVGFWVLALGLVGSLVAVGVGIAEYAPDYLPAGLVAFLLAGGLAIGLFPGLPGKEEEESPPIGPNQHGRLRALVDDVAGQVGVATPEALYVFQTANAYAGARRPRLFARKHATVGLGLPLLAVLNERELRSVVAHEMGHHARGDVALGPWVHRTRHAIGRTLSRLEGSSFWLHLPFVAYAGFFMKTSVRISRAQELAADQAAARVAGASATASALRKVEVLSATWGVYFRSEVIPVVEHKRLPGLLEGFDRYWRAAQRPGTPAFDALSAALIAGQKLEPDDTHPTLAERIEALGDPPPGSDDPSAATSLLDDVSAAEERVVRDLLRDPRLALQPVAWDAIADQVWLPVWRERLAPHQKTLEKMELEQVPKWLERWEELAERTRGGPAILSPEAERRRVADLLAVWLTVRLADRGFVIGAQPGVHVTAVREGRSIEPFPAVRRLLREPPGEAWARLCADAS